MPDAAYSPARRAALFGTGVGFALFVPLHLAVSAPDEVAVALSLAGALCSGGLALRFARPRGDRDHHPLHRGDLAVFVATIAVVATFVALVPPRTTLAEGPNPRPHAEQQYTGIVADASGELAALAAKAEETEPGSTQHIASVDVSLSGVSLATYNSTSGLRTDYVRNADGEIIVSGSSSVLEHQITEFDIRGLGVDDLNALFDAALAHADLYSSGSDAMRITAPTMGADPIVQMTVGAQSDAPHTVEADADGDLYEPIAGWDPSSVYDEAHALAAIAGIDPNADVVTELVFQGNVEGGEPIATTPINGQGGVVLYLAAAGPAQTAAVVYRSSSGVPVLQSIDPTALPPGVAPFAVSDIQTDRWWLTINDAGKPFYATDKDLHSVSVRVGATQVGAGSQLAMELQFGRIPGSHAVYTVDGQRLA